MQGDIPDNDSTPVDLAVDASYDGQLEIVGDRDWARISLEAGKVYFLALDETGAAPISDTFISLYSADSQLIASDQHRGNGEFSLLVFTPQVSGVFYLEAAAYEDSAAGDYTLTVLEKPVYSNDQIADYLRNGYWNQYGQTPRQFDAVAGDTITVDVSELTEDGKSLARAALQLWADVTGLNFEEQVGGAQIFFDDPGASVESSSVLDGGLIVSSTVLVGVDYLAENGITLDSRSFKAYIHEIGHALGLGHSGPYNGDNPSFPFSAAYANDSQQASVMSYFAQNQNIYVDSSYANVLTPQIADIIAVQAMYGAPSNTRSGDTTYGFNSTANNPVFDAEAGFTVPVTYTIFDTGGVDTLNYSGYSVGQNIDLRPEGVSDVGGLVGNVILAGGVQIENAIGGAGNDSIIGNDASNILLADKGKDTLDGGAGADTLNGEGGADEVSGGGGADSLKGGGGKDLVEGKGGGDILDGGNGNDTLSGGGGDDTLSGGKHADSLKGGNGNDDLSGNGGADTLDGGARKDLLFGGGGGDELFGGKGRDTLRGGGGDDTLDGGPGNDTFEFRHGDDADTIVDFKAGAATNDVIELVNFGSAFDSFAEVQAAASQVGADVVINFGGGDQITLLDTNLGDLHADDFIFG